MKRKKNKMAQSREVPQKDSNNPLQVALDLLQQGKNLEAESMFRQILIVAPDNATVLYSLAVLELNSGRHEEALHHATIGVNATPDFAPLWFVQGAAFQALFRREEALSSFDRALAVDPSFVEVLVNSGALLRDMNRHHDALERFHHALEIDPDHENALGNYGILLTEFKLNQQAVEAFERLCRKNPDYPFCLGLLCFERLHQCDWTDLEALTRSIIDGIHEGRKTCKTLGFMALSDSAADHYRCAEIFARHQHPKRREPLWSGERYNHSRIRIAYVSPDLREHPVGHLMAGVIESHDKSRFETIAISIGLDDNSRIRSRMVAAFDRFIDARDLTALQIAELMRQMEVDIAVDLAGYTSDARTDIFLYRPAPIQVNYLGYPGTMALDCYDYIIADHVVLPEEHRAYYSEKPVYLDHCYLPVASGVEVPEPLSRSEYGLPEEGFVFCAFSHDFKIHPRMFDVWMRLLEVTPDSVLWLMSRNETSQRNLCTAAQERGIDPGRLVFATRVPQVEDHLARYRVADLFLDTWPYNAHTTAADALLTGLPIVTYKGDSFPSRVAASLLTTLGYEQLITESFDEYFELANSLAHAPERLKELREGLEASHYVLGKPFAASLESAFRSMLQLPEPAEAAVDQPAPAENINDVFLANAQNLFLQGNLPLSEINARWSLAHNSGNSAAAQLLVNLRRGYGMADDFELSEQAPVKNTQKGYLLIKAWGYGFWSEVHHLAGQLLLAELTQRTPIVLWGSNCLFRREGDVNAFGHFFEPVTTASLEDVPAEATIFPAKWSRDNLYVENNCKWEGNWSRLAAQYLFDRPETLLVSDFYSTVVSIIPWIGPSSRYYGLADDAIYAEIMQKYLKPVPAVSARVEEFFVKNMLGRPWIGVHVRGSDKVNESPNLSRTNADYFAFIDRIIELNPTIGVFLLTDSSPVIGEFQGRYGHRLLYTHAMRTESEIGVHMGDHDGLTLGEEVLVDTLLAMKCDYFVGNKESNIALGIASMRNWPSGFIFLLGENIRGENPFLHRVNLSAHISNLS
jgi:predicted O-linked N-acetylglucosamine transferase (SPINDLY family)